MKKGLVIGIVFMILLLSGMDFVLSDNPPAHITKASCAGGFFGGVDQINRYYLVATNEYPGFERVVKNKLITTNEFELTLQGLDLSAERPVKLPKDFTNFLSSETIEGGFFWVGIWDSTTESYVVLNEEDCTQGASSGNIPQCTLAGRTSADGGYWFYDESCPYCGDGMIQNGQAGTTNYGIFDIENQGIKALALTKDVESEKVKSNANFDIEIGSDVKRLKDFTEEEVRLLRMFDTDGISHR